MSTKKIDELFRSKLADHAAAPGADAWARLQGKMNPPQNKKGFFWIPIAAAVALLILAGWLVFRQSNDSGGLNETLAEQTTSEQPELADSSHNTTNQIGEIQQPQKSTSTAESTPTEQVTPAKKKIQRTVQPTTPRVASDEQSIRPTVAQVTLDANTFEASSTMVDVPEVAEVPETAKEQVALADNVAETPMETPEVKITFIADDDERFLQPVKDLIASEAAKEKKNGFGKLIASARTLSNREILAELRESKDDLFNGNARLGIIKNEKGQ